MKRLVLILCTLLLSSQAWAWNVAMIGGDGTSSAGGGCVDISCTGRLICQNFEGTGYDNSESWSEVVGTGGTLDEDYTTSPAPLHGAQSLYIDAGTGGDQTYIYKTHTAASEIWGHILVNSTVTPNGFGRWIRISNGSGTSLLYFGTNASNQVQMYQGSTTVNSGATTISTNTTYHFWFHYVKGTGSDGVGEVCWGTGTDKGTDCISTSSGTATADADRVAIVAGHADLIFISDQLIIDDASFTSVCQ